MIKEANLILTNKIICKKQVPRSEAEYESGIEVKCNSRRHGPPYSLLYAALGHAVYCIQVKGISDALGSGHGT